MPFIVNDPGHVAEHNRLATALPASVTAVAPLASPAFTGSPTAPTPPVGDSSGSIATTAFVNAEFGGSAQDAAVAALIPDTGTATGAALAAAYGAIGISGRRPLTPMVSKMVTSFQAGHGFTNFNSTAASIADDTTAFARGTQSFRVTTKTDATAALVQNTALAAFDATGQQLLVTFRIDDITNVTNLQIYATDVSTFASYYQWTQVLAGPLGSVSDAQFYAKSGEWVTIALHFDEALVVGTPNRAALTVLRLRLGCSNGFSTSVNWGAIALSPEPAAKYVSFSFDDGVATQFSAARPILDAYGYSATAYLIAELIGTPNYLTLDQVHTLERVNGWYGALHAYYAASHAAGLNTLSLAALDKECRLMKSWADSLGLKGRDHLAWPLGFFTPDDVTVVRQYFASARSIYSLTRLESCRPPEPFRMKSLSVVDANLATATSVISAFSSYSGGGWLHLTFHDVNDAPNVNSITKAHFQTLVGSIAAIPGVKVLPVHEVLALAS